MGRLDLLDKWRHEDDLTRPPLSSTIRVREGDTGLQIESPEGFGPLPGDSLEAGSASIEWDGASNVAPPRKVVMPHMPWFCFRCQKITNPGYRTQCQLCNCPRPEGQ